MRRKLSRRERGTAGRGMRPAVIIVAIGSTVNRNGDLDGLHAAGIAAEEECGRVVESVCEWRQVRVQTADRAAHAILGRDLDVGFTVDASPGDHDVPSLAPTDRRLAADTACAVPVSF
jgi:hypothetical protein